MSDILTELTKYTMWGTVTEPKIDDFVTLTDEFMDITEKMQQFLNNIPNTKKRESMKLNVSRSQQFIIDNTEIYNELLDKTFREKE